MHTYNFNEMFILSLVALSIVGIVCLGLLLFFGMLVLGQKRDRGQQENNPSSAVKPPPATTTEPILDKLNSIQKEQRKSSAKTNASFGFAVAAFVAASFRVIATDPLMIIIGSFLLLLGLGWCIWNICIWAALRR